MNIFVCIKQVPDTETKIVLSSDKTQIETTSVKWIMNPYDEFAVEQALIMKSENPDSSITVFRAGEVHDTEALRTALAMGADEAVLIKTKDNIDSYLTAKSLKLAIEKTEKKPDIIFTGKQAIDNDSLQVPQMLAQMLSLPSVGMVVECKQDQQSVNLKREIEGGSIETYSVSLPLIVACNKGLNTPRYASLPGIMKAKKKPMTEYSLDDLGISENDQRIKTNELLLPPEKPPGKKFDALEENKQKEVVEEVVKLLREEAKVI